MPVSDLGEVTGIEFLRGSRHSLLVLQVGSGRDAPFASLLATSDGEQAVHQSLVFSIDKTSWVIRSYVRLRAHPFVKKALPTVSGDEYSSLQAVDCYRKAVRGALILCSFCHFLSEYLCAHLAAIASVGRRLFVIANLTRTAAALVGWDWGYTMGRVEKSLLVVVLLASGLTGCGLYVPEKDVLVNDNVQTGKFSPQGLLENRIVGHIRCEIRDGIIDALVFPQVQWLRKWGATVTLKLTVEDQSALAPGVSLLSPLGTSVNAFPGPQSFSLGLGLTGAANATRLETIAYTYTFKDLISEGKSECDVLQTGVRMQSDLKIRQFIYDKAVIAAVGESATANPEFPPYSTFQEDITFLASYGGSVTPTWKFARVTADTSGTTFSATRTNTDEVLITLGKVLKEATKDSPAQLSPDAQAVHNTGLTGTATGSAVSSQTH